MVECEKAKREGEEKIMGKMVRVKGRLNPPNQAHHGGLSPQGFIHWLARGEREERWQYM